MSKIPECNIESKTYRDRHIQRWRNSMEQFAPQNPGKVWELGSKGISGEAGQWIG